jgi:hypothetical protein
MTLVGEKRLPIGFAIMWKFLILLITAVVPKVSCQTEFQRRWEDSVNFTPLAEAALAVAQALNAPFIDLHASSIT